MQVLSSSGIFVEDIANDLPFYLAHVVGLRHEEGDCWVVDSISEDAIGVCFAFALSSFVGGVGLREVHREGSTLLLRGWCECSLRVDG